MKKGMLVIGRKYGMVSNELLRVLNEEMVLNRKSVLEDKIDNQIVILDGLDERLKETTLEEIVSGMEKLLPNLYFLLSVGSLDVLSKENFEYARNKFDVRMAVEKNFHPLEDEDIIIEGVPLRLKLLESSCSLPQFFKDLDLRTLESAYEVLQTLRGDKVSMEELNLFLHNHNNIGHDLVLEYRKTVKETEAEKQKVELLSNWFIQDYFTGSKGSHHATKTFERTDNLRAIIDRLVG